MYGVGENSSPWENCILSEFADFCPDLGLAVYVIKVIPSLAVLNNIFASGESNAGMGGAIIWKPFEIDTNEYNLLVEYFCSNPEHNIKTDNILTEVKTFKEWQKKALHEYTPRKRHDS